MVIFTYQGSLLLTHGDDAGGIGRRKTDTLRAAKVSLPFSPKVPRHAGFWNPPIFSSQYVVEYESYAMIRLTA